MQHVDEGQLHAYLDGELTPVERQRVDEHLAGCEACRVRLGEERELAKRASDLLGLLEPPLRAEPSFTRIRERAGAARRRRPLTVPLAWAATVLLAIGIGWYARGSAFAPAPAEEEHVAAAPRAETEMPDAARQAPRQAPPAVASRGRAPAPAADAVSGAAPIAPRDQAAGVARAQANFPEAMIVTRADTAAAKPAAPAPSPAAGAGAMAPAREMAAERRPPADSVALRLQEGRVVSAVVNADAATGGAWREVRLDEAAEEVGAPLVVIPGLPVEKVEVAPVAAGYEGRTAVQARVLHRLGSEYVIRLNQRRVPSEYDAVARRRLAQDAAAPRAATVRIIGGVLVEISSTPPIPADSLHKLLARARPAQE